MTSDYSYPPPVVPPTPPVNEPKRPLYGRVFAVVAIVFGVIFVLGGFIDGVALGFIALGIACVLAGVLYLKVKNGNGRKFWIVPALAILPALIAAGLSAPAPTETETASEQRTTTTATTTTTPPTTTTAAPTTTTTASRSPSTPIAPVPFVATVTTTTEPPAYIPPPVVETEPEYVPPVVEPEPEYVPPAPVDIPEAPPSVSYANCAAVRAAGAAPIYAGQPGYSFDLDRDRDGVACDT